MGIGTKFTGGVLTTSGGGVIGVYGTVKIQIMEDEDARIRASLNSVRSGTSIDAGDDKNIQKNNDLDCKIEEKVVKEKTTELSSQENQPVTMIDKYLEEQSQSS